MMLEGLFETAAYMQNRELSWLKFNERVLLEASRERMPPLEKLKFISIFSNNLDEFFMIRVGSLEDSVLLGNKIFDNKTGMSAKEQLNQIYQALPELYTLAGRLYTDVISELAPHGIKLRRMSELSPGDLKAMKTHFQQQIMPLLSPSIIDTKHPFPHLPNKQLHIISSHEKKKGGLSFSMIAIPAGIERLVFVDEHKFVLLEDLVSHFIDLVFVNYAIKEKCIIAVTRNADFDTAEELLDEDIDFRQHMKSLIKKRQRMAAVRLEIHGAVCPGITEFLCNKLSLRSEQVFSSAVPLDLRFGFTLHRHFDKKITQGLIWPPHNPADSLPRHAKADMIKYVLGKDILLSFPYESMSPFLTLIRQASEDPLVISIKITLYRIDAQSKLAEYLINAAENGKEVVVLMELRARFDENNNIEWANRLEEAGCRVIYGLVGFKCHSKLCLISRMSSDKLQFITHIGTGNYNEKTAKLYTDLSLITANQEIGRDASAFFTNMLMNNLNGNYKHLWVAPNSFKTNVMDMIEHERQKAIAGKGGRIIIKCNSLTDKEIIEKLVEAGDCGVKITMNVRGICCLVPQLAGVTDNIQVMSIVGKFLEHSRIYCFGEGDDELIYISSADLMTRNTQRRVEVACPILDPDKKKTIKWMLDVMFNDDTNAWDLQPGGSYILRTPADPTNPNSSQEIFTRNAKILSRYTEAAEKAPQAGKGGQGKPTSKLRALWGKFFGKFKKDEGMQQR